VIIIKTKVLHPQALVIMTLVNFCSPV